MPAKTRTDRGETVELTPEVEAAARAVSRCVHQLARTLKTCKLYETSNATVEKFRHELTQSLRQTMEAYGPITLRFTADDVTYEEVSLYQAKSRDDNLAFPFYRDGIRTIVFSPGIEQSEVDLLVNALARVTGQNTEQDDLVTLLWEATTPHIQVDYVPGVSDSGEGAAAGPEEGGVPWPTPQMFAEEAPATEDAAGSASAEAEAEQCESARSDDWPVGAEPTQIVAGFEELLAQAPLEVERFRQEFENEHRVSLLAMANGIARVFIGAAANDEDLLDGGRFVSRVLRQSVSEGAWSNAIESLRLLERCNLPEWSAEAFAQELLQPISIAATRDQLERQSAEEVSAFVEFALALGESAPDLLNLVRAEVQNPRHQRLMVEAIVTVCREQPERLGPWLDDSRPAVVKGVIQMLGTIGGAAIVGPLQAVVSHPDVSVRTEVVNALRQVDLSAARPLLKRMLDGRDPRLFCSVLALLSQERNEELAARILSFMTDADFERRSPEEKRAIYSAIGATATDAILPILESELHKGSWFARGPDLHQQAVARCIAKVGTPYARQILEHGAQSRRGAVKKACQEVLARGDRS